MRVIEVDDRDLNEFRTESRNQVNALLLYALVHQVPETYTPIEPVLAMSVGPGRFMLEGTLMRDFHKARFGVDRMTVACCDTSELGVRSEDYDINVTGRKRGDASSNDPWLIGLDQSPVHRTTYDYVHMNNPYVRARETCMEIIRKGCEMLDRDGVMTIMSTIPSDLGELMDMYDELEQDRGLRLTSIGVYYYNNWALNLRYACFGIQLNENQG